MLIRLSDVLTEEGKQETHEVLLSFQTFTAGANHYKVIEKGPLSLTVTNLGDQLLRLEGKADITLQLFCDRCLDEMTRRFSFSFEKELNMGETERERVERMDEQSYIQGFLLDPDQLATQELLMRLPMKILCREDCKGICETCGANLNRESCDCQNQPSDPRMAAILDIFKAATDKELDEH